MSDSSSLVSFSIGSNIDREKNVALAVKALMQKFTDVRFSPIYVTEAVGFKGDDFFNLVGQFKTMLELEQVRAFFHQLEQQSGRSASHQPFEDRTLDLDLLLFDDLSDPNESMKLPHPDILVYDFVLMPLSKMMPDFIHPQTGQTLAELWAQRTPKHRFSEADLQIDDLLAQSGP